MKQPFDKAKIDKNLREYIQKSNIQTRGAADNY